MLDKWPHPLDPLSADEIFSAATITRAHHYGKTITSFRVVSLAEPPKKDLVPYLEDEKAGVTIRPDRIPRVAMLLYTVDGRRESYEAFVDLRKGSMVQVNKLDYSLQMLQDTVEMKLVEETCLKDTKVQEQIKKLDIPPGSEVVIEPWTYATDSRLDRTRRVMICYFYLRPVAGELDSNFYGYPLDICAYMDGPTLTVTQIVRIPRSPNIDAKEHLVDSPEDIEQAQWVVPETRPKENEYMPDLMKKYGGILPRQDLKPYRVVQPDGPSFIVSGNEISWQKWKFRVGFNYREGMTLHNISYDGRSVFYRLSLSEMFVPYGDPRAPYHLKAAFDLGNNGAGVMANNLQLGCDCLGSIKYFDFVHVNTDGTPKKLPHVICCHEQDDGILFKHTNYRTEKVTIARSRQLVLQSIITVANYEYIFAFIFDQAGAIHYEVRATGIVSTTPFDDGADVSFGTRIAPGALAPHHQHIFSLRIDPAIDGHNNSILVEDSVPIPMSDDINPHGVGYESKKTYIETEDWGDLDPYKARNFTIVNENVINPVSRRPVGYKIMNHATALILAHPDSFHYKRAEYARHSMWFTKYHEGELFSAGKWTNQSAGGIGINSWIESRKESIRNEDLVVWATFSTTHNVRPEDWPVMPIEKMGVTLKPAGFFTCNPALDVPTSTQAFNQSVLVTDETAAGQGQATCCSGPTPTARL